MASATATGRTLSPSASGFGFGEAGGDQAVTGVTGMDIGTDIGMGIAMVQEQVIEPDIEPVNAAHPPRTSTTAIVTRLAQRQVPLWLAPIQDPAQRTIVRKLRVPASGQTMFTPTGMATFTARQTRVGSSDLATIGIQRKDDSRLPSNHPGKHHSHPATSDLSRAVATVISTEVLMLDSREIKGPAIIASQPVPVGVVAGADRP